MGGRPQLRFFGIPVRVELFFVISAVLLGSDLKPKYLLLWVLIVFVSVLVHELGHAFAYRAIGAKAHIVLTGFAGLTFGSGTRTRRQAVAVSLAGPLAQIVVLGLPARALRDQVVWWQDPDRYWLLDTIVFVSIGWALLNLVPILPLDGGHVAEAVIGRPRARVLSVAAAGATFLWMRANGYSFTFLPLILGLFNVMEIVQARKGQDSFRLFPDGGGDFFGPAAERRRDQRPARKRAPRADLRLVGDVDPKNPHGLGAARPGEVVGPDGEQVEALVWEALRRGEATSARRALDRHPRRQAADPYLVASVDLANGDVGDALARFRAAYLADPNGPRSLVPATLLAAAGRAGELARALLADRSDAGPRAATSLQSHLHYAGAFEAAAEVGQLVHADGRASRAQAAFEAACSWSRAGQPDDGLRWLAQAIEDGFTAPTLVDGEPDLEAVRGLPGFPAVRARLP